ncbi:helix-turn-helix transcriptional regulator [Bradyrhizobium sp. AZCC 2289]|uniref:helix-turn-helix transcriptional regulator n=1 Tax=Bradyrhizobium sp. AZCC 2289 TaxID=3117026 RepID=UPI002FF0FDAA
MHHIFRNFIESLSTAPDAQGFRDAMAEAATALDLSCFAYLSMPRQPRSNPTLIANYPLAWTEHYLRCHYERLDPVIIRALRNPEPFEWGLGIGTMGDSKLQQELFAEAATFGIRYGFTVPVHDHQGPIAAVTFAADERLPRFEKRITEHGRVLQLMAMYFHAHARRRFDCSREIGGVPLSPREFECLEWAARGKSAWEIGRILGISRRTAAFHLDNAKAKLGVHSICQAVARLIASGATMDNPTA